MSQSKRRSADSERATQGVGAGPAAAPLPMVVLHADRLDLQVTCAMYAKPVVETGSRLAAPSSNLLHHCHSHTHVKVSL